MMNTEQFMAKYGDAISKIKAIQLMTEKEKRLHIERLLNSDFIDISNDYGFKYVFSRDLDLLKMLLEDILSVQISKIEYLPQEILGSRIQDKHIIMDVGCIINGRRSVVEMQSFKTNDIRKRLMYYGSMLITDQLPRGADIYNYQDVNVVAILNENLNHTASGVQLLYRYRMMEEATLEAYDSSITITVCELPNLMKKAGEDMSFLEMWFFYFQNMKNFTNLAGGLVLLDSRFSKLMEECRTVRFNDDDWKDYITAMLTEEEKRNLTQPYYEDGLRKGVQEGFETGIEQVAKNMLADGVSLEFITKYTGLDKEAIQRLQ